MPWLKWGTTMNPADGWATGIKEGFYSKTFQVNNCTVTVHRPILDDQERAKREEKVRTALKGFIKKGI